MLFSILKSLIGHFDDRKERSDLFEVEMTAGATAAGWTRFLRLSPEQTQNLEEKILKGTDEINQIIDTYGLDRRGSRNAIHSLQTIAYACGMSPQNFSAKRNARNRKEKDRIYFDEHELERVLKYLQEITADMEPLKKSG